LSLSFKWNLNFAAICRKGPERRSGDQKKNRNGVPARNEPCLLYSLWYSWTIQLTEHQMAANPQVSDQDNQLGWVWLKDDVTAGRQLDSLGVPLCDGTVNRSGQPLSDSKKQCSWKCIFQMPNVNVYVLRKIQMYVRTNNIIWLDTVQWRDGAHMGRSTCCAWPGKMGGMLAVTLLDDAPRLSRCLFCRYVILSYLSLIDLGCESTSRLLPPPYIYYYSSRKADNYVTVPRKAKGWVDLDSLQQGCTV